jgi:hypothetical protein
VAEIEHDLGYKLPWTIPPIARRRFSRIAGLLELADSEFNGLRHHIRAYEVDLMRDVYVSPDNVPLTGPALKAFVLSSPIVARLDRAISESTAVPLAHDYYPTQGYDLDAEMLRFLGLATIGDAERALAENERILLWFTLDWFGEWPKTNDWYIPTISMAYFEYVVAAASRDESLLRAFCDKFEIGPDSQRHATVEKIFGTYERALLAIARDPE